jgi:hypothetical protein
LVAAGGRGRIVGMPPIRRIVVLAVEGVQSLDVFGPVEVFDYAERGRRAAAAPAAIRLVLRWSQSRAAQGGAGRPAAVSGASLTDSQQAYETRCTRLSRDRVRQGRR